MNAKRTVYITEVGSRTRTVQQLVKNDAPRAEIDAAVAHLYRMAPKAQGGLGYDHG